MKIVYIPTGNAFTLPDEEVLRIMSSDRDNYKIVEGGLQKEAEDKLPPQTVKELIVQKQEPEEEPQEQPLDYDTLSKNELVAVAKKLNITVTNKDTKATLLEKIHEKLGK
jgi:hypothetical protein